MIYKEIILLVALVAAAAADKQDIKHGHPPHHAHGHHPHGPVPANLDPEAAPSPPANLPIEPLSAEEETVEDEFEDIKDTVEAEEENVLDEESEITRKVTGLKSKQGEIEEEMNTEAELKSKVQWVDCDYVPSSRISCYDCQTRLICKYPGGGKLVPCNYSLSRPYCNNGICSTVPSAGCA